MTTVGSKYRGTKEFLLIYKKLITAAQLNGLVYYQDVASILGIETPGHHMAREVGQVLGEISEDEHVSGRPMLSAIAISTTGMPSDGFFNLANRLGKFTGQSSSEKKAFWKTERAKVYKEWSGS